MLLYYSGSELGEKSRQTVELLSVLTRSCAVAWQQLPQKYLLRNTPLWSSYNGSSRKNGLNAGIKMVA